MSIKFTCPNCHKGLNVKDELAGQRRACPACRKVLTVPAPTSRPADIEDLAASAFAEDPAPAPAKPTVTTTIDLTCPYCDEPVQFGAELGGKQAPCPHCRRIIKVPLPVKEEPLDWRKAETRGPSGARREEEPAPVGAWGTGARPSTVSREALEEAEAIPEEKEPLTVGQWVRRGLLAAAVVGVALGGWLFYRSYQAKSLQEKAIAEALAYVEGKSPKLGNAPETYSEVYRGLGAYYLKADKIDDALKALRQARAQARAGNPASSERNLALLHLALTQVDLAGTADQVDNKTRLSWPEAARQWEQTITSVGNPAAKREAIREVCRKLISKGQFPLAAQLVRQTLREQTLQPQVQPKPGPKDKGKKKPKKKRKEKPETPRPNPLALLLVLHQPDQARALLPNKSEDQADLATLLLYKQGWLRHKNLRSAVNFVTGEQTVSAEDRLECLLSLGVYAADQGAGEDARACVTSAAGLIDGAGRDASLSPWLLLAWARLAVQLDQGEVAAKMQQAIRDLGLRAWVDLEKYRRQAYRQAAQEQELAADSWSQAVPAQGTLAQGLAFQVYTRFQAGRGDAKDAFAAVADAQPEKLRPLGYVGVALGAVDRK
jgi:hypothetical protein